MTVLTNARLVLDDQVMSGSIHFDESGIIAVDSGPASGSDCEGDYLMPGLVELHTDNVERHFMPRPRTYWPNHLAALAAHDNEVAGAGITTVFDALGVGNYEGQHSARTKLVGDMVQGVARARSLGMFKAQHRLHIRCELSDPTLMDALEPMVKRYNPTLVSLMDHTPGQRQWRDLDAFRIYLTRTGRSPQQVDEDIALRMARGSRYVPDNWNAVTALFSGQDVTLATHDDTTIEDIDNALASGIRISEFPCSLDAARHANAHGMATIGGAPNIVRGGSHSGNVSIMELARSGILNGLSSDYVPTSLLQAPFVIARTLDQPIHETIKMVTSHPAGMVGLKDRGILKSGLRADIIRVKMVEDTPVVRKVYVAGRRVC